jgi:hypothetical protein
LVMAVTFFGGAICLKRYLTQIPSCFCFSFISVILLLSWLWHRQKWVKMSTVHLSDWSQNELSGHNHPDDKFEHLWTPNAPSCRPILFLPTPRRKWLFHISQQSLSSFS